MIYLIFIIGAIMGSCMGAFISRRDNIKSFIFGRSECESCGKRIKFYNNIPIFSYIFLKGRCRDCNEKIDFSIFLIEIFTAIISSILYKKYGLGLQFYLRILQAYLLILIAFTDIRFKYIYSLDAYLVFFLELIYKYINNLEITRPIVAVLFLLVIYYLIHKFSGAMGSGDVILGAVSGFFASDLFQAFIILRNSFIIAAIFSLIFVAIGYKERKDQIAFCPYITIAIMEVIL